MTYVRVDQNKYKSGQRIKFEDTHKYQEIHVIKADGIDKYKLDTLL